MANLIVGDFRSLQLQRYNIKSGDISLNYTYLLEDTAEYSWLANSVTAQLPLKSLEIENVILMLGFNDCAYSCVWEKAFNIDQIASDYVRILNEFIEQYKSLGFYVCSVAPVETDYPFAEHADGRIPAENLNKKIQQFNNKLNTSNATFIDCYNYLSSTGFSTYDGVRYMPDTSKYILGYISSHITNKVGSAFVPRLTAPIVYSEDSGDDIEVYEGDTAWISASHGGLSPFNPSGSSYAKSESDTLPNCTAYAWGRFYEILGVEPKLSTSDKAEDWYNYTTDGYRRGDEPIDGAIICWEGIGANTGFVAVVEQINSDGSIITSESLKNDSRYWWTSKRTNENGNWGADSDYKFRGFIYCPATMPTPGSTNIDKSQVIAEDRYLSDNEKEINATYIWNYLGSRGWSLNAVAGMLGNIEHESSINPGRGEVGGGGFGLVQWTPKSKFTDWLHSNHQDLADNDIDGQLERIIAEKDNGMQYSKTSRYNYDFNEFSTSTASAYDLACAFAWNYERSGVVIWGFNRAEHGQRCNYGKKRPVSSTVCRQCYQEAYGQQATEEQMEKNREALRKERGCSAEKWYSYLYPHAPSSAFADKFIVNIFKIDNSSPTAVQASFLVKNSKSWSYIVLDESNTIIDSQESTIDDNSTLKEIIINCESLKPNSLYTIKIEVNSAISEELIEKVLTFTTPQSLPKNINSIVLKTTDIVIPHDTFQLEADALSSQSWGYWKKPANGGYTVQLIINGKVIAEKETTSLPKTLNISDYFNYDSVKIGDIIQIGIRTWVLYDGKPLYDSNHAKCSNPICMLVRPVTTYLNKDKIS